jgi:hypothetical protein
VDGGLQEQEVAAIEKIKAAFSDNLSSLTSLFVGVLLANSYKDMVIPATECSLERLCRFSFC